MEDDDSEFSEGCNLLCRWFHWALFFVMVVAGSFLTGLPGEDPENYYFTMAWAAVACLLIETCYLGISRFQVSLVYLLLATTYLAVTGGAGITAFNLSRHLFAD